MPYNQLILKNGSVTTRKNLAGLTTAREYHRALAVATLKEMASNDFIFAGQIGLGETLQVANPSLEHFNTVLESSRTAANPETELEWYPAFKEAYTAAQRMYHAQLMELKGPSSFFWDIEEYRTDAQLERTMKHVIIPAAKEMVSRRKDRWVGPTGLGVYRGCSKCNFTGPCKLVMDGANYKELLQEEYELREVYKCQKG